MSSDERLAERRVELAAVAEREKQERIAAVNRETRAIAERSAIAAAEHNAAVAREKLAAAERLALLSFNSERANRVTLERVAADDAAATRLAEHDRIAREERLETSKAIGRVSEASAKRAHEITLCAQDTHADMMDMAVTSHSWKQSKKRRRRRAHSTSSSSGSTGSSSSSDRSRRRRSGKKQKKACPQASQTQACERQAL